MRIYIFILILLLKNIQISFSQVNSTEALLIEFGKFRSDVSMLHASIGMSVKNITTGKIIFEYNSQQSLTPASVMKLPLTMAALEIVGGDYRFSTNLGYIGYVDLEGTLHGDMIITGSGDPTFGSKRFGDRYGLDSIFHKWHNAIKKSGIMKINGAVIGDAEAFEEELIPGTWQWSDFGNYYGAGASGLNVNENYFKIFFSSSISDGANTKIIRTEPEVPYIKLINNVKTGRDNSGDNVIIYGAPYINLRTAEGCIPKNKSEFEVKGSLPDPSYHCAYAFHKYLEGKKIIIINPPSTTRIKSEGKNSVRVTPKTISTIYSPALREIIRETNISSINTYAEALLKLIALKQTGRGGLKEGINEVKNFWIGKKINTDGFMMFDGSGLSPTNKITTSQLTSMLEYSINRSSSKKDFINSLPTAGMTGGLKNMFAGTIALNNLKAKSGYMSHVRAYAGITESKNKQQIVFAIIVNNYTDTPLRMKVKLEKIMTAIANLD